MSLNQQLLRRHELGFKSANADPTTTSANAGSASNASSNPTDSFRFRSALNLNAALKYICQSGGSRLSDFITKEFIGRHKGNLALNRGNVDGSMKVPKTTIGIRDLGLEIESLGDVYKVLDFIRNIKT
ncbi:hypothetical protein MUCCIDRAFT_167948 [Mucor lusitanicus CBS 277.49]|uniref:Uncharacterized protein n=1 Tax=Mucor lusitanicus CBS 277.49 TaxID=747725 RepID=A0A168GKK8_MUCCL|nr:hypothetical protein MUCCIDRAFT_167948 [Mucor lusitanicus CBS 277.49]